MGRLIDADAIREKVEDHVTTVSVCVTAEQARGETQFKQRVLDDIDNAPTIDVAVNLNDCVRFKLTDYGKKVYNEWFLNLRFNKQPVKLDIDELGYTKMQLWQFIEIFGPHIHMWEKNVIEPLELVVEV